MAGGTERATIGYCGTCTAVGSSQLLLLHARALPAGDAAAAAAAGRGDGEVGLLRLMAHLLATL